MAARQRLEMIGEGGVDRRAADRAEDRRRLRGDLLAHHDSEARRDLRDQPRHDRRGVSGDPLRWRRNARCRSPTWRARRERRNIRSRTPPPHPCWPPSANTSTQAKAEPRGAQVLAFLARDLGDRAQEDRGRDRQFDRQRRQSERAADRAGRGGGELMGAVGRLCRHLSDRACATRASARPRSAVSLACATTRRADCGMRAAQQPTGRPIDVGQALREARPFQASDRPPQIVGLLARQSRRHVPRWSPCRPQAAGDSRAGPSEI